MKKLRLLTLGFMSFGFANTQVTQIVCDDGTVPVNA